jgi:signal transduction histidine kinase
LFSSNSIISVEQAKVEVLIFVEELEECLLIQLCSTKIMSFSVNDMLSLAQLNTKKFRKEISSFDVKSTIHEIMMIQRDSAAYRGVKITLGLAGFGENKKIWTDQIRLQQVLLNLQSNALKFSPNNSTIKIRCELLR